MRPWDAPSESPTFGLLDKAPPVRVGRAGGPKAHVLVCAPSNSALDEIVARLLQSGLLDWCARTAAASLWPQARQGAQCPHHVDALCTQLC